jgi:hypothetical protein
VNPLDRIINGLLTGFGRGLGYRASRRVPLWLTIVVLVGLYLLKGRH